MSNEQNEERFAPTLLAIISVARMVSTDPGVVAGIINQATAEERAQVKDLAQLTQLFFSTYARVARELHAEVTAEGIEPPKVDLKDFDTVLAQHFKKGRAEDDADDDVEDVEFKDITPEANAPYPTTRQ